MMMPTQPMLTGPGMYNTGNPMGGNSFGSYGGSHNPYGTNYQGFWSCKKKKSLLYLNISNFYTCFLNSIIKIMMEIDHTRLRYQFFILCNVRLVERIDKLVQ